MHHHVVGFVSSFWAVLVEMSPYLLFGFLMAGLLSVLISPKLVERHLGGRGILSAFKAALFGVPLPLCSCSVIPVATSLRRHGASRAATTAFLISAPQTGADSILVTYSLLGGVIAIFRPIAALVSGMIGGIIVGLLDRDKSDRATGSQSQGQPKPACQDACCADNGHGRAYRALAYAFIALPADIGRSLLVGLLIAALISTVIPPDFFTGTLHGLLGGGVLAMLIMMLLGVPVYVCATASVPIAAALIAKGVSPGAALAFLMTGPATNAATIATIWRTMGTRTAVAYLVTIMGTAMAAGLSLDFLFTIEGVSHAMPEGTAMLPHWLAVGSAFVLIAMLGWSLLQPMLGRKTATAGVADDSSVTLHIGGMTCQHCVEAVRKSLLAVPGVRWATIELKGGRATVGGAGLDAEVLNRAVQGAGYNSRVAALRGQEPAGDDQEENGA
ncbi:MAG: SO_0444 family Cu/Zn efflux transporter [Phycisphaerae bacterium]